MLLFKIFNINIFLDSNSDNSDSDNESEEDLPETLNLQSIIAKVTFNQ